MTSDRKVSFDRRRFIRLTAASTGILLGSACADSRSSLSGALPPPSPSHTYSDFVIKVYARWQTTPFVIEVVSAGQDCPEIPAQAMFGVGTPAIAIDRDGVVTMLASGEPRYAAPQYVEGRLSAAQLRELLEKAASLDLLSEPPTYHALGDTNVAPTPNESGVYPWLQYNGVEFVTQGQTYVHLAEQLLHPNQETDENRRRLAEFLLPFHDNAFASAESLELSPYSPKEWSIRAKELMPVPEEASLHPFHWTASTQPLGEMGSWVDIDGPALSSALSTVYTSMSHDESTGGASGYYCYTSVAPVAPTTNGGSITSPTVVAYGIEVSPFPAAVMRLTGFPAGEKWVVDDLPPIYPSPPCVIRVDS